MTALSGRIAAWHAEHGWGAIDSQDLPSPCWFHVSSLRGRWAAHGMAVQFEAEEADQDGYRYRASLVWRDGELPPRTDEGVDRTSAAYTSRLVIRPPGS